METKVVKGPGKWELVLPAETEIKKAETRLERFRQYAVNRLSMVPRELAKQNPLNYGMPYEEVDFFSRDSLRLSGWYIPALAPNGQIMGIISNSPTIIVAHGYRKSKASYLEFAHWLWMAGYNVFMLDFRGHGYSEGPRGTSIGYMERLDVLGAVDYLNQRGLRRLGIVGVSMGAAAAILAASENQYLRAVVADSSYSHLYRSITNQIGTLYKVPRFPAAPVARWAFDAIAEHHGFKSELANPADYVHLIAPRPLFLIHGEADSLTGVVNSRILYKKAQGPKELWTIPGVEHVKAFKARPDEYRQRVLDFFAKVQWQANPVVSSPVIRDSVAPRPILNNVPRMA
jgi:fermentation-respiration switch protein FrsA (DUF1100 family)